MTELQLTDSEKEVLLDALDVYENHSEITMPARAACLNIAERLQDDNTIEICTCCHLAFKRPYNASIPDHQCTRCHDELAALADYKPAKRSYFNVCLIVGFILLFLLALSDIFLPA